VGAYEETLAYLYALEVRSGWDLRLERMRAVLARRGHPERAWPALHVAGTNGKGSTAAMLEAVLRAAGHRTGLYTSPHLVDFTERIRIDGRTIPRETVVALVAELRAELVAAGVDLTHFELATLLAFEWFRRVGIDVGVIEVGLGGRLDATNVVRPIATAITSIARDHEEYLGREIGAIAAEKAGIVKPGVPLVVGRLAPEADGVIADVATRVGAPREVAVPLEEAPDGTLAFRRGGLVWNGLRLGLPGGFQRDNAAVALTVLARVADRFPCAPDAVRRGLAGVRWPGRLAVVAERPRTVLDGAHNPAGAATLAQELPAVVGDRPVVLVFAVMADKDWRAILAPLLPRVARVVVTRVGRRGLATGALVDALAPRLPVEAVEDPHAAVARGRALAGSDGAVLVAGSLFLVGEAYTSLAGGASCALFEAWKPPEPGGTEAPT
jgi:dihydrofolate synthase/folylpolyglutamate synthase